jgi:hypothetical protein
MNLKAFVSTSLTQLLDGIREAQKAPGGGDVAAEGYIGSQGNLMSGGTSGHFTLVEFDVAVFAETKEGQPGIRVADLEIAAETKNTTQTASRVKFSVHVRLPKGGAIRSAAGGGSAVHDYNPFDHDD